MIRLSFFTEVCLDIYLAQSYHTGRLFSQLASYSYPVQGETGNSSKSLNKKIRKEGTKFQSGAPRSNFLQKSLAIDPTQL